MNNEIKEILESLAKIAKGDYYPDDLLYYENCKQLLDYITKLEEENNRLKELCNKYEEEHSTTFEYWKQIVKEDYKSRNEAKIHGR